LDETMYCRHCRPQATQPRLILTIHFNDGTSRSMSQLTSSHLRELKAFLKGEIKLETTFGDTEPLQQYLPHLETMLGEKATP
ncbi:MAG: hypothetical protein NTY53_02765, partial [Kiritimatiellaeota bacterium]|nr:hypothetical protein [Kiritimatiellota bacterium]